MKQIASAITTTPKATDTATGTPHGERGLATRENTLAIAAWLAGKAPQDVDKVAVSRLSSQHGVCLEIKYNHVMQYDANGNKLGYLTAAGGCNVSLREGADLQAALSDLENFQTPAPKEQIEMWLAELSVTVAKRQDDHFADALRLEVYSSRLCQFPADVAKTAILETRWKFWPTWAEMEEVCDRAASIRRHMAAAIKRGPQQPEKEWRHATPEERARIQALVDELFPKRTPEERAQAVDAATSGLCMFDTPSGDA